MLIRVIFCIVVVKAILSLQVTSLFSRTGIGKALVIIAAGNANNNPIVGRVFWNSFVIGNR